MANVLFVSAGTSVLKVVRIFQQLLIVEIDTLV